MNKVSMLKGWTSLILVLFILGGASCLKSSDQGKTSEPVIENTFAVSATNVAWDGRDRCSYHAEPVGLAGGAKFDWSVVGDLWVKSGGSIVSKSDGDLVIICPNGIMPDTIKVAITSQDGSKDALVRWDPVGQPTIVKGDIVE